VVVEEEAEMHGTQGMEEIVTITVPLTHTETGVARQVSS
jgi:hypothetical protein